jgi:hypothetical protein
MAKWLILWPFGTFCGHSEYFSRFGTFCVHLVYFFPVLVCRSEKNLATLVTLTDAEGYTDQGEQMSFEKIAQSFAKTGFCQNTLIHYFFSAKKNKTKFELLLYFSYLL